MNTEPKFVPAETSVSRLMIRAGLGYVWGKCGPGNVTILLQFPQTLFVTSGE